MIKFFDVNELVIPDNINQDLINRFFPRLLTIKILIVADTSIRFSGSFGLGKVIDIIRENVDGYVNFAVDLARLGEIDSSLTVNNSPEPKQAKYINFRFSSQIDGQNIIDDYDEIWCFGFAPGNDGSRNDDNIWNSSFASTDNDLAILTQWMNAGGGILAMGDHHYLGAAMCARIPRVGTMRRWTNAQNVPPINGIDRIDTNRPQNDAQDPNINDDPEIIPNTAERDNVPQIIEYKRYFVSKFFSNRNYRPHPLLCGGELGIIDVLPDHPHEGWIFENEEIDLDATYNFNGISGDEYPSLDGVKASPEVIAWGNTYSDPPYNFAKGETTAKRFGVIGAYDGDRSEVGRVVVDSTWHHWLDLNIAGLESESPNTEYQKIIRYYRNCAVWLARKWQRRGMLRYATFFMINSATGIEEFSNLNNTYFLGEQAIDILGRMTSDCIVRDWINDYLPGRLPDLLDERIPDPSIPIPNPCWSCPPIEIAQNIVMGGIMKELLPLREEIQQLNRDNKYKPKSSDEIATKLVFRGAEKGLEELQKTFEDNLNLLAKISDFQGLTIRQDPFKK